jgi:hypothetical protein
MPTPLLHRLKLGIGLLLILIGGMALIGWMVDIVWIAAWTNNPNDRMPIPAATCFMLCGLYILIQAHRWVKGNR